ncbi:MAG: HAD-IA family hydrolase [Alphaproteobacteria bacterium]|nr:HAD-IA family hydrolase [Alphaproteobacteria bacterium]MCB9691327.1 HAD-IA family hydrolase [Alphaproteobacteria bacterium]
MGLEPTWPTRMGADPDAVGAWLSRSPELAAFERGHLSTERFYAALGGAFGASPSVARQAFCAWVTGPLPGAAELLDALTLPAFALSNTNVDHWAVFDPTRVLRSRLTALPSHHLGARKPETAAFQRATDAIGTADVLFLDDSPANVEAARAFGWRAERVVGVAECQAVLREAGALG